MKSDQGLQIVNAQSFEYVDSQLFGRKKMPLTMLIDSKQKYLQLTHLIEIVDEGASKKFLGSKRRN